MEEPFGTKGGTLPPFLERFQQLNEDYNKRLLIRQMVSALLRYHITTNVRCRRHSDWIEALTEETHRDCPLGYE